MMLNSIRQFVIWTVFLYSVALSSTCTKPFEGFGVFLGSVGHISNSPPGTALKVFDQIYYDLGIRHYRTSIESQFSPSKDIYKISCTNSFTCTWIEVQEVISRYENVSVFASIWSPPHYMKNIFLDTLEEESETKFHEFIRNITSLIQSQFNLTIEKVSPVNEPENLFAPWEHTNMSPYQLCSMVQSFNDPLISLCPENSYYWMSELYSNYSDSSSGVSCHASCEIQATHAYTLNLNPRSPNKLLAYYDTWRYERRTDKPIWMTEVSSTFAASDRNQMEEGIDFATNIVNFLGTTCVQRYYFWYAFTVGPSGESLIWGFDKKGNFIFPKKYFVYRHFTRASFGGPKTVTEYRNETTGILALRFGSADVVLINKDDHAYRMEQPECKTELCCTSKEYDWLCLDDMILPKFAVCSCKIDTGSRDGVTESEPLVVRGNLTLFTNEISQFLLNKL